ncbi:MAG TPA: hypothetical protein DCY27_11815 [Desulfobacterales bacterium]|nr:hypothetical protein [Desulfobacterales bacterium]
MLSDEKGSVAVVVAVCLFALVGVLGFSLDTAFLYVEKNHTQNAVEAAALAGATNLCAGDQEDIEAIVRNVAAENGLTGANHEVFVTFGFYDEMNDYGDFPVYKDFVEKSGMPAGEYVNAVAVTCLTNNVTLTGLNKSGTVAAMAVAFLRRFDMVSLDGDILLGHNSQWQNCTFYSNGDIKYPASASMSGKSYGPPTFSDCRLLCAGQMLECPVTVKTSWSGSKMTINWDGGSPHALAGAQTGVSPITEIRPVDEDYLKIWKARADVIYTPADAGKDNVFYSTSSFHYLGKYHYNFDLGGLAGSERRVIFFDAGNPPPDDYRVLIGPKPSTTDMSHTPNGYTISNLTFVTTCPILITHLQTSVYPNLSLGSEGQEQVLIISPKSIEMWTHGVLSEGVVFRTGGDFLVRGARSAKMRVIADGDIDGDTDGVTTRLYYGMLSQPGDCRFGPPCPPVIPKLGLLESSGN